jgi:hypothetical protein
VLYAASGACTNTLGGPQITITGTGTCMVIARQAGNASFAVAAPIALSVTVEKALATVAFDAGTLSQTYSGTVKTVSTTTTPGGLAVVLSFVGAPQNAGTYAVTATINDLNYTGASTDTLTIGKANAAIVVNGFTGKYDGAAHGATGTATGVGGENLFALLNLSGSFTSVPGGTAPWTFAGDTNYNQASGSAAIVINKGDAIVALSNLTQTYTGSPLTPAVSTTPAGLAFSLAGAPVTNAGSYPVAATVTDQNYAGSTVATFVVNKASATVELTDLTQAYTGSPLMPIATTTPPGLAIIWTGAPATNAGSYAVTATVDDANYAGSAAGTLTITNTAAGADVPVTTPAGSLVFSSVVTPGVTVITPIADATALNLTVPGGFAIDGTSIGVEITTTATVSGAIGVCLDASTLSDADFASAVILHGVAGEWLAQVTTRDAITKRLCTSVTSLSPFAVARVTDPIVTWSPAAVTYGTALGAAQLNAAANVPGKFSYDPAAGALLTAGQHTLSLTFTPDDVRIPAKTVTSSIDVAKAAASVTFVAGTLSQTYSGTLKTVATNTSPLGLSVAVTFSASPLGAGSYLVTATITDPNYTAAPATGTLTVSSATLSVAANDKAKVVGAVDPPLTFTATGFVGADTIAVVTGALARVAGEAAGSYQIRQGTLAAGPNYTIAFTPGTLVISAAPAPPPPAGISIAPIKDQYNAQGDEVDFEVVVVGAASRISNSGRDNNDGDRDGAFSATGLPGGVKIDKEGEIHGRITANVGTYNVTVTFTRNGVTVSQTFKWTVKAAAPRKGGKG